jgi:hypothetical protein
MADVSRRKEVAIVTHEDFFGNFIEQYLAVFFKELRLELEIVSLLQDIQGNEYTSTHPEEVSLSRKPYTKKIVNKTERLKSVDVDLMIVLGHGKERDGMTPSAVCFAAADAKWFDSSMLLRASRYFVEINADGSRDELPGTITTLADVTARSKLAIVLCCRGDEILQDFLSDGPTGFTDMLICDREDMDNQSFCIFFVLLVNLIDSDVSNRPLSEFQYTFGRRDVTIDEVVKRNIRRIFQIVRQFGTTDESSWWTAAESFWDFLKKSGCVSSLATVKANQGLENSREKTDQYYRVSGIPWNFALRSDSKDSGLEYKNQTILDDFKALKLVRWDAGTQKVVCEDWQSSFDHELDVYQQLIPRKRPREGDLGVLLERLRLSSVG